MKLKLVAITMTVALFTGVYFSWLEHNRRNEKKMAIAIISSIYFAAQISKIERGHYPKHKKTLKFEAPPSDWRWNYKPHGKGFEAAVANEHVHVKINERRELILVR